MLLVHKWLRCYMQYLLPFVIGVVYLKGYYDMLKGRPAPVLIGWMAFAAPPLVFVLWTALHGWKKARA